MFDTVYEVAVGLELVDGFFGCGKIFPVYGVFPSECRLVYLGVGRSGGDAAQIDGFHTESVARTEHRTDIVERPYVVKHDDKRQLRGFLKLLHRQAGHFYGA